MKELALTLALLASQETYVLSHKAETITTTSTKEQCIELMLKNKEHTCRLLARRPWY